MTNYIIRRLLLIPVLLFGVTVIIFAMIQTLGPVERSALYVRDFPKNDKQIQGIITRYGLDKPLYEQYWRWLVGHVDTITGERKGGILYGDFGYSRTASQDVAGVCIGLGTAAFVVLSRRNPLWALATGSAAMVVVRGA